MALLCQWKSHATSSLVSRLRACRQMSGPMARILCAAKPAPLHCGSAVARPAGQKPADICQPASLLLGDYELLLRDASAIPRASPDCQRMDLGMSNGAVLQ